MEKCIYCGKVFKPTDIIIALYGMLFCTKGCGVGHMLELDVDSIESACEEILASDIGV